MEITQNCIINGMPENVYHNDPTPKAKEGFAEYTSLSSTVATAIVEETEIEARAKINRFNPKTEEDEKSDSVNLGSIVHDKVLLGGSGRNVYEIVPFDSFRTNDAKARRDDLISRGIIPLAQNEKTEALVLSINTMEQRLHEQMAEHLDYPNVMASGAGEQSGFYYDEKLGIWKRARFDWLDEVYQDIVWDYKTTALSFDQWINQELWKTKYIQAPHYTDVLGGIKGEQVKFGFIVQRTVEPYLAEIVVIDQSFIEDVRSRYDVAQKRFVNCLKTGEWRGASRHTKHAFPPAWILNRWESDKLNDELVAQMEADKANSQVNPDVTMAG